MGVGAYFGRLEGQSDSVARVKSLVPGGPAEQTVCVSGCMCSVMSDSDGFFVTSESCRRMPEAMGSDSARLSSDDRWEAHVCAVSLSECVMQGIIEVGDALCAVDDVDVYGQPLCELGKRGTCDE